MNWTRVQSDMAKQGYVASDDLSMALHIALTLGKPLLLEGAAGVGKTDIARTLARAYDTRLIRLQCYEGLDAAQAIYEWNYQRQLLAIRAAAENGETGKTIEARLFSEEYLLQRPLLQAIRQEVPPVLLIDEIDRADDEFEAFLLELLSDFQITIPEIGTVSAATRPIIILTSNRTRELHDALKRRCLYSWIGFPSPEREIEIVRSRIPQIGERLAQKVVAAVNRLRDMELEKVPGVAETIDWVQSLNAIGADDLDEEGAAHTLGAVIKSRDDMDYAKANLKDIVAGV